MTADLLASITREAIAVGVMVAAPVIGLALGAGVLVSLFQAVTQIQEATLSFVPKIVAVAVAFVIFGPWMVRIMVQFTANLLASLPTFAR